MQVDEINEALANNVRNLAERDGKISELSARAERLETDSEIFQVISDSDSALALLSFIQKTTRKLKQREMMKSIKIPLLFSSVLLLILTVIVLTALLSSNKGR